ncbi:phosphopantetheinyl transferase-like protein [Lotmaria passim]
MNVTIVCAAKWQPSCNEFMDALHQLHRDDSVRSSIEEAQQNLPRSSLQHHISIVKSRLLARHLFLRQLRSPAGPPFLHAPLEKPKMVLALSAYGKPMTSLYQQGDFSISHVSDWVCCAHSICAAIGVDIVAVEPDGYALLPAILSQNETAVLQQNTRAQQSLLFSLFWALKESVLKALGLGLSSHLQMSEITLSFDSDTNSLCTSKLCPSMATSSPLLAMLVSLKGAKNENWKFSCAQIAGDTQHIFAVVAHGDTTADKVIWQFESYERVL